MVSNGINQGGDIALVTDGSNSDMANAVLADSLHPLSSGTVVVAVDTLTGDQAAQEQAQIDDAISILNSLLNSRGVTIEEIQGDDSVAADVHLHLSTTSVIGGMDQGVLGVTQQGLGEITIISGWNYYYGSDPAGVGNSQYDFETVVAHELGHSLGLGHSTDTNSVMYPYLGTGQARRSLTSSDLAIIDNDGSPADALMAANFAPGAQSAEIVTRDVEDSHVDPAPLAAFANAGRTVPASGDGQAFLRSVSAGMGLPSVSANGSNGQLVDIARDVLANMPITNSYQSSDSGAVLIGGDGQSLVIGGIGRDLVVGGIAHGSGTSSYGNILAGEMGYSYRDGALLGQLREWDERNGEANSPDNRIPGAAGEGWAGDRSGESLLDFESSNTPSQFPMQETIYLGGDLGILDTEGVDGGIDD
jgi:hypothetical protein